jgi:hypothetical protein
MVLISFQEQPSYTERISKEWKPILLFIIFFYFLISLLTSSFTYPILICAFMALVYYLEILSWTSVFIKDITIDKKSNKLKIVYFEKNILQEKELELNKIILKQKFIWYKRSMQPEYLLIRYDKKDFLKQYRSKLWTQELIKKTVENFNELK